MRLYLIGGFSEIPITRRALRLAQSLLALVRDDTTFCSLQAGRTSSSTDKPEHRRPENFSSLTTFRYGLRDSVEIATHIRMDVFRKPFIFFSTITITDVSLLLKKMTTTALDAR